MNLTYSLIGRVDPNSNEIGVVAGINLGNYFGGFINGSGTDSVKNLALTSNVNIIGVWIFQVDGANIQSMIIIYSSCDNKSNLGLRLKGAPTKFTVSIT